MKWATASLRQTLQRVRAADVNSDKRRRKVKVVSTEENGKSRTYETYHILDTEYNKTEEKKQTEKLKTLIQSKQIQCPAFHFHASLTRYCILLDLEVSLFLHLSCVKQPGF